MRHIRIIPRLDIKGPNLVKGIHLEGLRVLGRPENFAKYYYETGADEIFVQDVVASLYDRNSLSDVISRMAKSIFVPITVGGGIRTLDDINNALRAGADKVAINTAALKNPEFIKEASRKFGSSTIVVAIEAIRQPNGKYFAFTDNGREYTGQEVVSWANKVQELGAGEIVLTSVDKEGTGQGLDLELIQAVAPHAKVPFIVHGGAGNIAELGGALASHQVDAIALASALHYHLVQYKLIDLSGYESEGNSSFVRSGKSHHIQFTYSIGEMKKQLSSYDLDVRILT